MLNKHPPINPIPFNKNSIIFNIKPKNNGFVSTTIILKKKMLWRWGKGK